MSKWCVLGGDARATYLAQWAEKMGKTVVSEPPCDVLVLQFPHSSLPEVFTKSLPKGQKIICGMTSASLEILADEYGWQLLRPLEDEKFNQKNAIPSAEGALWAAMQHSDSTLESSRCVVVGYGRIGKVLTKMLRGLGAQVTVAARRAESRLAAGESSVEMNALSDVLPQTDLLFNTVPARVLTEKQLTFLRKDALVFDLSSAPYGVDIEAAERLGLQFWREPALPARYAPKTAARYLFEYVEAHE